MTQHSTPERKNKEKKHSNSQTEAHSTKQREKLLSNIKSLTVKSNAFSSFADTGIVTCGQFESSQILKVIFLGSIPVHSSPLHVLKIFL